MLFLQVLDAIVLRDAAGGLGIVSAAKLPKKQSWYTELPGGKGAIVAVDLDNIEEHGDVALEVAYRVLRAQIVADARRKAFASLAESSSSASPPLVGYSSTLTRFWPRAELCWQPATASGA
jgi:hypothetical protein